MRKSLLLALAAGGAPAQTTLLASTFENASNDATVMGRAFTGGTVGGTWRGGVVGATFRGSSAQHRGSGDLSGLIGRTAPRRLRPMVGRSGGRRRPRARQGAGARRERRVSVAE